MSLLLGTVWVCVGLSVPAQTGSDGDSGDTLTGGNAVADETRGAAASGERAAGGQRVLILHSYGTDFEWTRDMDAAIREELHRPAGRERRAGNADTDRATDADRATDTDRPTGADQRADTDRAVRLDSSRLTIHSEMLDAKYHTGAAYMRSVRRLLGRKYAGWHFDVIIVTDNFALEFIREFREELWPETPVVFAGINNYEPGLADELGNATGVAERLSAGETLEQMRRLFPDRVNVYVLSDGSATGRQNMELAWEAIRDQPPLTMTVREPITVESLERLSRTLGKNDIAMLVGLVRDRSMTPLNFQESGRIVSELLPVPVFSLWDFYMGTGIAGGYVASGTQQGRRAAELAKRILAGEASSEIPVVEESPNVPAFDYAVLSSFGINQSLLPEESVVYNEPVGMWAQYRFQIISAAAAFFLLVSLLLVIYEIARRRGIVAREASASLREKETLLREIHHRVKNNLQVVSSMLSIQSAFLEDERSIAYFQDARTRIQSMALVHEHLYQSPTLSRVEMKSYVDELVSTVVNSMDVSQTGIRVVTDVGEMTTDVDNAIPLGMLINELLSNALKYAYPNRQGEIRVFLGNHDAALVLEVADHGIGLSEDRRLQQESLGLRLVQALGEQLGAAVDYIDNKPGLRVYVRAPLTQS